MIKKDQVSHDRWNEAQKWEEMHWISAQKARAKFGKNIIWRFLSLFGKVSKYRGDDSNHWWKDQFDGYNFLPSSLENALEVGCGPYTNMRLILDECKPRHLFLSDPLIKTYIKFRLTFVSEAYKKAFCVLDDHPLEALPFADNFFDLTVMINVLDHVKDAQACMDNLIRVTKPNGIILIGQDLTNDEDMKGKSVEDIGHPIKLDHDWFSSYLHPNFTPIKYEVLDRESGRAPESHYGTLIFAGSKI